MVKGARFMRGVLVAAPISAVCWATILIPIIAAA
jgi:hypothetical protein